jgi:hypothetical protein
VIFAAFDYRRCEAELPVRALRLVAHMLGFLFLQRRQTRTVRLSGDINFFSQRRQRTVAGLGSERSSGIGFFSDMGAL